MSSVSTYLNFSRNTKEVFVFYRTVFGTDYQGEIMRMGDMPAHEGAPSIAEEDKNLIMHLTLPITGGHLLMGSDAPESMNFQLTAGNNMHINIQVDTREETERLFHALSEGGQVTMELADMFWGDYFGSCTDRYGVQWMFNCPEKSAQ